MNSDRLSPKLQKDPSFVILTKAVSDLLKKGYEPKALMHAFELTVMASAANIENAENLPTTDSETPRAVLKLRENPSTNPSIASFEKEVPFEGMRLSKSSRSKQSNGISSLFRSLGNLSEFSHIKNGATFAKAQKPVKDKNQDTPGPATYRCKVTLKSATSPTFPKGGKRVNFAKQDPVPGPGTYRPMHYPLSNHARVLE